MGALGHRHEHCARTVVAVGGTREFPADHGVRRRRRRRRQHADADPRAGPDAHADAGSHPDAHAHPDARPAFDTSEYRATVGAVSANALTAYNNGGTGRGIKVGVVDSGLDIASDQFIGRVDPASANVAGGTTYDDEDGHGTAVAFTIAGVRNGAGTQGIAFDATIIAARADTPGTCANTTGPDSGCSFDDANIATRHRPGGQQRRARHQHVARRRSALGRADRRGRPRDREGRDHRRLRRQ